MTYVLVVLCIVALILYLVNTYVPMDGKIKQILNIVVVVLTLIWLLTVFNVIPVPKV